MAWESASDRPGARLEAFDFETPEELDRMIRDAEAAAARSQALARRLRRFADRLAHDGGDHHWASMPLHLKP